jgi:hypothetical protein
MGLSLQCRTDISHKYREPRPLDPLEKPNLTKKRGKFVTVGSEKKKKETIGERRR